jgi:hypothetical protein
MDIFLIASMPQVVLPSVPLDKHVTAVSRYVVWEVQRVTYKDLL